ncbi:hypothetical protein [Campylobacter concisus]|nr:hypothetical protein [Campylobacter concisus]
MRWLLNLEKVAYQNRTDRHKKHFTPFEIVNIAPVAAKFSNSKEI